MACCYKKYAGVSAISERVLHDLCWNVREHSRYSSRLKLFEAFIGFKDAPAQVNEEDTEEPTAQEVLESLMGESQLAENVMQSQVAVTTYFNLVCEVHREIATAANAMPTINEAKDTSEPGDFLRKVGILSGEDGASAPDPTESGASGESKGEPNPLLKQAKVAASDSIDDIKHVVPVSSRDSEQEKQSPLDLDLVKPALVLVHEIETLLPSSTTGNKSRNESDIWLLDADILKRAVTRWSLCIAGIDDESRSGFSDLVEAVRATSTDPFGRLNVDDFLWVIMQQWVLHTEYLLKKTAAKTALALKNSLEHIVPISMRLVQDHGQSAVNGNKKAHEFTGNSERELEIDNLKLPSALRIVTAKKRVPAWTLSYIKEVVKAFTKPVTAPYREYLI